MQLSWIGVILLTEMIGFTIGSTENVCRNTEKCNCINVISSGSLEFQCPPSSYEERKIIIHVFGPSRRIKIDCIHIETLNDTLLPEGNFSTVEKLEFQDCPLPENGFKYIVDKFSLHNLRYLRFAEHNVDKLITSEDLQELETVEYLELKRNNISTLNGEIFKNIPKLSNLIIDENKLILTENIFGYIQNLLTLSINSNNIDHIPKETFKNLDKLSKLSLWQNNLKMLQNGIFDNLVNLKMLELSLNKIEVIEDDVFQNTHNLTQLSFRRNKLVNVSRTIFENCQSIEFINLDENPKMKFVDNVFSNFSNLKYINLAYNELETLPEYLFDGSVNLERITLNNNRLKTLPTKIFQSLKNLKDLHLESNKIEVITPELLITLENLEHLYLQRNKLTNIHEKLFNNMKNLKEINLSYNKIQTIPIESLWRNKNLERFIMSHNLFNFEEPKYGGNSPFSSLSSTNLKEVDLSFNNITRYPYQLNGIATIEFIKLHHNRIEEITVSIISIKLKLSN